MFGQRKESLAQDNEDQDQAQESPKSPDVPDQEKGPGKYGTTQRGLKSRHIQLIALGGVIGTGLFVGTGSTLSLVGPAPLFMGILCPLTTDAIATGPLTLVAQVFWSYRSSFGL